MEPNRLQGFIQFIPNMVTAAVRTIADCAGRMLWPTDGNRQILGPFQGRPACTHIPITQGVCGAVVLQKKTQRVCDVNALEGHIACGAESQSEIVIPIIINDRVVAVLDIDSPVINRFDEDGQRGLEGIVATVKAMIDFSRF